jgi:hypothetical protein
MAANAIGALPSAITADSVTRGPDSTSTVTSSRALDSPSSGSRGHPRLQIALVAIDALEKRRQVIERDRGKAAPNCSSIPIAKQTFRHADVSAKDDAPHCAGRHQVVAHGDAPRRARDRYDHVLEPSEPHEVSDALAHRRGRQRRAHAGFNQLEQRRVRHRARVDGDRLADDRFAQAKRRRDDLRRCRNRQRQGARGKATAQPATSHQKTYLTRMSSA